MGYKIVLECPQTQVGEHGWVGYRSGDQLPVGHPDAGPDWKPVIVEVEDEPPVEKSAPVEVKPVDKPVPAHTPFSARQTGSKHSD